MKRSDFKQKSYQERLDQVKAAQKRRLEKQKLAPKKPKTRKTTKASKQRRKRGEWSTKTADNYFSIWIRDRDGQCLKCGTTENLTCSHFHSRRHKATRFDPDNCHALCGKCHEEWEGPTKEYKEFVLQLLGLEKYLELDMKAATTKPVKEAVAEWKQQYEMQKLPTRN